MSIYADVIEDYRKLVISFNADTVYVGGGTPTALDTRELERLLER